MKLPRDMGGEELVTLLGRYGYQVTRQTGSHKMKWVFSRPSYLSNWAFIVSNALLDCLRQIDVWDASLFLIRHRAH